MDPEQKETKCKEGNVSKMKWFFEIKRPRKPTSSTLPRTKSKQADTNSNDVSRERMFTRNESRRTSSRKNKYKREVAKEAKEKVPENNNRVKQLCQKFADIETSSSTPNTNLYRSLSEETVRIPTKSEMSITELREQYKKVDVKRRNIYEKNHKEQREQKTRSFADAMTDEETEKYRRSLVEQIDEELAHMKDDGFLDELENLITDDNDCDIYSPDESTFLSIMSYRSDEEKYRNSEPIFRYSDDSERTLIHENSEVGEQDNDDYEGTDFKNNDGYFERGEQSGGILDGEVFKPCGTSRRSAGGNIDKLKFPENKRNIVESQGVFLKIDTVTCNSSGFDNEFTESLGDDLENGLNIVEAYNDDGRELIEVQVVVDRRVVNFETLQNLQEDLQQSEMVFYQNADQTYECHYPADEHIYDSIPGSSVDDRKYDVPTNKNITGDNYREKHSPVEDNSVVQNMYYSPANINAVMNVAEEPFYETVGYLNPDEKNAQNFYVYAPDSNRSTIYSTTSRDSSVFDEDDEGIELGRPNHEDIYPNVRRETFCDAMGVVRIERVAFPEQLGLGSTSSSESSVSSPVSRSNSTTSARKLEYIIEEIKTTERKYVEDLAKVVQDFRPFVEKHTPESMKARQGYLFGNIEKMYKRQLKFLASVEESGDEVNNIVRCFIDHDRLFEMYPNYFRNKPKADTVLKEFSPIIKFMQERFEERLDFSAYLLTPVQRLGKYILFLENIEKELKKLNMPIGSTQMALDIVKSEMSKGNDYVAIDSIQNSPISKLDYGSFKMREHFSITKPRRVEAMVFLFENVVVLTTSDPNNHEIFNYYDSIKMNDLRIATFENFTIHLTDYTKSKKKHNSTKYTYVMEAKTEKIWNSWRETIESILWQQLYKAKELTLTAQNTKYRFIKNKGRVKSTGSSVFYVE